MRVIHNTYHRVDASRKDEKGVLWVSKRCPLARGEGYFKCNHYDSSDPDTKSIFDKDFKI